MTESTNLSKGPRARTVHALVVVVAAASAAIVGSGCTSASTERSSGIVPSSASSTATSTVGDDAATRCDFLSGALDLTLAGVPLDRLQPAPNPDSGMERTLCSSTNGGEVLVVVRTTEHGDDRADVVYPAGEAPVTTEQRIAHPRLQVLRTRSLDRGTPASDSIRMSDGATVVMVGLTTTAVSDPESSPELDVAEVLALGERLLPDVPA